MRLGTYFICLFGINLIDVILWIREHFGRFENIVAKDILNRKLPFYFTGNSHVYDASST